jgi:aminopeptidase N
MENKYGKDTAVYMLQEDREQVIRSSATKRAIVDETPNYMDLLNSNSYQKGGWVLHMLRQQLGDDVFHKAIRAYYKEYANSNADTRDLQKVFEQVSGKDLSVFFDQWLYRPGIPNLGITWGYNEKTKKTWIEVKQLQENDFAFTLPVKLITKSGKGSIENIDIRNRFTHIEIDGDTQDLIDDPETTLLFQRTLSRVATK